MFTFLQFTPLLCNSYVVGACATVDDSSGYFHATLLQYRLNASLSVIREKRIETAAGINKIAAEVLVRKVPDNQQVRLYKN